MALDVAKGAAAVLLANPAAGGAPLAALAGAAAVVGHIYPVWLRFHGGKGVAVAAGVFSVLSPIATAVAAGLFLLTVCAHAVRVARIDCGDARAAAGGLVGGRSARGRRGGGRHRRADPVPAPRERAPAPIRNGAEGGGAGVSAMTVLGAGSWGTALSVHLAREGRTVRLWARDPQLVERMSATRENPRYLPGAMLPPGVTPMSALGAGARRDGLRDCRGPLARRAGRRAGRHAVHRVARRSS